MSVDDAGDVSPKQAAAIAGVSTKTIYRHMHDGSGRLPFHRIGRAVRIRRSDLETYRGIVTWSPRSKIVHSRVNKGT